MDDMDVIEGRLKATRKIQLARMRDRYALAKYLGLSGTLAGAVSGWSEDKIREFAKHCALKSKVE